MVITVRGKPVPGGGHRAPRSHARLGVLSDPAQPDARGDAAGPPGLPGRGRPNHQRVDRDAASRGRP